MFFSKKLCFSTPLGQRTRVAQRFASSGSIAGDTWA